MSSEDGAISVRGVSKHYLLFKRPEDRLKQSVIPRLRRLLRQTPRQYYRDFAALRDISFDIKRGETVGVIGRNGCGKSTLLQIICGILQPTSGSVSVNGRIAALLELGSGFNREFTGRENVYMNGAILGLSKAEISKRFDAIVRFADIGEFIEQPVKTYSSGMQVRLAFATAVNVDPDILVVDEALAVGDDAFRRKCYARLEEIQNNGSTVLFVSHSVQTIVQLCSRAMLLDQGELLVQGDPKTVCIEYQRLINASSEAYPQIRAEIQSMRAPDGLPGPRTFEAGKQMVGRLEVRPASASTQFTPHASIEPDDSYAPALKPQSTIYLEERGARIRDARILALDGREVNMLKLGRRYALEYHVDFFESATDVGCGISIRKTEGLKLAGASTKRLPSCRIPRVRPGESAQVRIEFSCLMLPGTYFVTCGVGALVDGEQIVLHRVIDALMLQVQPEMQLLSNGSFDISPSVTLTLVPSERDNHVVASSSVA